ncbi:MAG: SDR family oxidoreductase [Akkermansiaceae bacterium]|nr:SDR family oxidoreductase [Akkermansiaceae bacterium]
MEHSLNGSRILVTGAGSGIGRAAVELLAKEGADVALLGRTENELTNVFDSIRGGGGDHLLITADISVEEDMRRAAGMIGERWGCLSGVVANAGINGVWAPLAEIGLEEWNKTLAINLGGTFLTVRETLPLLRKGGGGSVVVVASINGTRIFSNSGATAYACSKAAQVAFSRMLALECAKDRIRFNTVCPGAIETNIDDSTERRDLDGLHLSVEFPYGDVPLTGGAPGTADQVARAIWFLLSGASDHISGTEIYVDGVQSLLQG